MRRSRGGSARGGGTPAPGQTRPRPPSLVRANHPLWAPPSVQPLSPRMSPYEVPQDQFEVLPEWLSQSQGLERPPPCLWPTLEHRFTGKRRDVQAWGRGPSLASQRPLCLSSEYLSGNSSEFRVPVFLYLFTMLAVQNCCVFCNKTTPFKKKMVCTDVSLYY